MDLRSCSHLHFIQAIKGGLVTKVLNVTRGRPTLSLKEVTDIYDSFVFCNDDVKAEKSCASVIEERLVKTEPDASACNANDVDDRRNCDLDDKGFENITLKQIKEKCKTRKRKHSQGIDSSQGKIKIDVSLSLEEHGEMQMAADDSDFMETLSSWRSKLSKSTKTKNRKCIKDPIYTYTQDIIPVVKSEEIPTAQEFAHSCGDSVALVEVKFEETDYFDHLMKLSNVGDDSSACDGQDYYYGIVVKDDDEITHECVLENELNYVCREHADLIPLQVVWASSTDTVVSNSELTYDQSPNFPAIEFESEECIIHPGVHYMSPKVLSFVEDHNSDIYDYQPDGDTPVSLPNVAAHEGLEFVDLGCRDDSTFLSDFRKDKFTYGADVQAKISSTSEYCLNPDGYLVCSSDDSSESEEMQSLSFVCNEKRHEIEATDELTSSNEHNSSFLHCPKRLLSKRKTILPSSQERLTICKAMESIDIYDKEFLKCRGKLYFGKQTDKKNGTAEGLNKITRARFVDNPDKVCIDSKTLEKGVHPKSILKSPRPSFPTPRLSTGCSSVQSCSKSAIAFSMRQMHEAECLTMRLTKELKSMKDIVDEMLQSEFCLNRPLRCKVDKARVALRRATKTEETTKRCLSIMARNCGRFCKLMKLADDGPAPQDVVRKERTKIAFADEAGGRLCQVRFYEDDGASC